MKTFTESNRFEYSLTPDDWVLMLGGYQGKEAEIFARQFGCKVVCYEPITEFYNQLVARFIGTPWEKLIFPVHAAVGAHSGKDMFGIRGDMSGFACQSDKSESVDIVAITSVLVKWTQEFGTTPALCVMNIEGGEYQCLPALLDAGMDTFFGALQVQPHAVIPNAAGVWAGIRSRLLINFRITSEDPDLGTGWILLERK